MNRALTAAKALCWLGAIMASCQGAFAETPERSIEIPTREGVSQRFLYLAPANAKAAVILFSGGQGSLKLGLDGSIQSSGPNFLVRNRQRFAANGLSVAVVDAPSDRQAYPFLTGFRETPEHLADIKVVIAWLRKEADIPVWLVGTSRGTQSAAFIATQLRNGDGGGADGLVLTSTILSGRQERAVTDMRLSDIKVPVLVVHHEQDGCKQCPYAEVPRLLAKLTGSPNKELIAITGGEDRGDPCQPFAHHGFNGQDDDVVRRISAWVIAH